METGEVLETLDEYKGEIGYIPDKFPVVLYYKFDKENYRTGSIGIRQLDWISIDEINKELI